MALGFTCGEGVEIRDRFHMYNIDDKDQKSSLRLDEHTDLQPQTKSWHFKEESSLI